MRCTEVPPVFRGLEGEEGGCDVLRCRQCSGDWKGRRGGAMY